MTKLSRLLNVGVVLKSEIFDTSGTFTVPANVYGDVLHVYLIGGGGGGAGSGSMGDTTSTSDLYSGGGGGGGKLASETSGDVIIGGTASYTVTLGSGGAGSARGGV